MSNTLLKPKGVYWKDLSNAEVAEIRAQIPKIENDPSYRDYKFYRTRFHKWVICNIWTVPMTTAKAVF